MTTIHPDIQAQIEALTKANAELKAKLEARNNRALTWKVSEKEAASIYGLGRFPVTLYLSQARKLDKVWVEFMAWVEEQAEAGNLAEKD